MPADLSDALLIERSRTHGDYEVNAAVSQKLKGFMHGHPGWFNLSPKQRESLDLIATKIGRILAGDPNHADHWNDVAGYARLNSRPDR